MRYLNRHALSGLLVLSAVLGSFGRVRAEKTRAVLTVVDFETGDLSQADMQKAADDSIVLVTAPVRAGKHAVRTLLRLTDPEVKGGQRAEFQDGKKRTQVRMDTDYWYGLSLLVPEAFAAPAKKDAVLFQWHTQDNRPGPVLAIRVRKDQWLITTNATGVKRVIKTVPLEKGQWTDWVVHAKWASTPTGHWTLWKNGVKVIEERDVVTQYPEELGPYAKFGQYHSVDEATPRNVVYVDEYRVGGAGAAYADVAPPGERPPVPPAQ